MADSMIAYFSRSGYNYVNGSVKKLSVGNTEIAARILQKMTGADLYKIEPVTPYSSDYYVCIDEARRDLKRGVRPELKSWPDSLDGYYTLYLGYPNYWDTMPMAVCSFLERYDLTGKVIFPFCTHEEGGMGRSESDLRSLCPTAQIKGGLPIRGADVRKSSKFIENWLQQE